MDLNFIEITPKTQKLTPADLTRHRHVKVKPVQVGSKKIFPTNTAEEAQELDKLYEKLHEQLSVPRIDSLAKRIVATWLPDRQAAKVQRKVGKLDHFGYNSNGDYYLEFFETLFLLELGRLKLDYHGVLVSIEQAYLLTLGEEESLKYNEYLVYSNLSRVGFILIKHKPHEPLIRRQPTDSDCIWAVLQSEINGKAISSEFKTAPNFLQIQQQFKELRNAIMRQEYKATQDVADEPWKFNASTKRNNNKRKADVALNELASKRAYTGEPKSLLDVLKTDAEYQQFRSQFEQFELVELRANGGSSTSENGLTINFDLYLHNDGFKRSAPKPPTFSVIILGKTCRFPTHDELSACYRQQHADVPLLVVSVSDSKQLHAFLFYFS